MGYILLAHIVLFFPRDPCLSLRGHGTAVYLERRYQRITVVRASSWLPWVWLRHLSVTVGAPWLSRHRHVSAIPNKWLWRRRRRQCHSAATRTLAGNPTWKERHATDCPTSPNCNLINSFECGEIWKGDVIECAIRCTIRGINLLCLLAKLKRFTSPGSRWNSLM